MSVQAVLILVGGPVLLTALALVAGSLARGGVEGRREWTWVRATWVAALLLGGVAAWLVDRDLDLGRGAMLVPAVLGLFVVAGVGLSETVVRPQRPVGKRTASLAPRRVADYAPPALTTAVVGISTLHLLALALTTVTASTDDLGHAGRQVAARCGDRGSAAGPYPGSFYSVPLTVLLVVIGVVAAAALTAVVRRPRGSAADDPWDDELRRRSTTRVLAAAGAAVSASHAGVAFFAGTALLRLDCHSPWMRPVGAALVASVLAAVLLLSWFLGRVLAPGTSPSSSPSTRDGAETR
jgi:hypothetical protein